MEKSDRNSSFSEYQSSEISLVDLAKIVIKWRKIEFAVWVLCFLVGLAYVLLTPRTFEFSSVYQMAMNGDKPIEPPAGLLSKIENFYEPALYQTFSKSAGESSVNAIKLNISNPKSTALVVIHSVLPKSKMKLVRSFHQQLLEKIGNEQTHLLNRKESALKSQLKTLDEQLNELKQGSGQGLATSIASTMEQRNDVQQTLNNLSDGQSLVLAQPSLKPKGPRHALVILLSLILGLFLALFAGFGAEFVAVVNASYRDQ